MKQIITREEYRARTSEHALQVAVLGHLRMFARENVFWFAVPNAGKRPGATGVRMKAEGLSAGVADLCIMLPDARTGWLEMKTARGKQSPAQRTFEAICRRLGHPYALANTIEEAIDALREMGALK